MVEKPMKPQSMRPVRTTVSIPVADYEQLERIAIEKKVSVAWVVRDAIERYLRDVADKSQGREKGEK